MARKLDKPNTSNAVRTAARYSHALTSVHWKAALTMLQCLGSPREFGILFHRGKCAYLEFFVKADHESKATER